MGPIINQCEASWFKGKVKPRTPHIRFCRVGDKSWSLIIKVKKKIKFKTIRERVWYIHFKIKNYYLKICVKIYVDKKICKNMCNVI